MKTLVFSDTHLSSKFDLRKYNFLCRIINSADRVIINGDFWDGWITSFDQFVNSKWRLIFPLLLSKNTLYIHGNHDTEDLCDQRTSLFSVTTTQQYTTTILGHRYVFHHGHDIANSYCNKLMFYYAKMLDITNGKRVGVIIRRIMTFLGNIGYHIVGIKRITSSAIPRKRNQLLKDSFSDDSWHIFGDTHCAELDAPHSFANSGCTIQGYGSYLMIDNGQVSLHQDYY